MLCLDKLISISGPRKETTDLRIFLLETVRSDRNIFRLISDIVLYRDQ